MPITPRDDLETGMVNDIAYYRCQRQTTTPRGGKDVGEGESTMKAKTLLLFHGAAFTKENWRESGILSLLCSTSDEAKDENLFSIQLDVYAFDLPVKASPNDLKSLLDEMHQQGAIPSLPVDAIVTPSASGKMVVEWDPSQLPDSWPPLSQYASLWMPIASPAVASVQNPQQQFPAQFDGVEVVAVHGDQDAGGKRTMEMLARNVPGADVVEMRGRHPCYLDSPREFVELVLERLGVLSS